MSESDRPTYNIHIQQAFGPVIGDHATVSQTFQAKQTELPAPKRDVLLEKFRRTGAELEFWSDSIAGVKLDRSEVEQLYQWVVGADPRERLGVLLDQPGSGKTVIVRRLREKLLSDGIPTLTIKADAVTGVRTPDELQAWLGFSASIEASVRHIADKDTVVVLVDQLDALSLELSRDQGLLDTVLTTIARLREVAGARILVSCRTFDLRHDPKLSLIEPDHAFELQPLNDAQVDQILQVVGVNPVRLLPAHRRLLQVPLHLALYARLAQRSEVKVQEGYYSLQELYNALWQHLIAQTPPGVPSPVSAVFLLVDRMQERRETRVPVGVLDGLEDQARYLQQIGFLHLERGHWQFYHQTLLDYCFARRFVAQGRSLFDETVQSAQGLFERSQLVQLLAYLRGTDPEVYRNQLRLLLGSQKIRTHLRLLVLDWFGSVPNPSTEEQQIASELLSNRVQRVRFLGSMTSNSAWFDALSKYTLPRLLDESDNALLDAVANFLGTVIRARTSEVIKLLRPYAGRDEIWAERVARCLAHLENWNYPEALTLVIDLVKGGRATTWVGSFLHDLARSNPGAGCRLLREVLDRGLSALIEGREVPEADDDSPSWRRNSHADALEGLLKPHGIREVMEQGTQTCPNEVIAQLLPWYVRAATWLTGEPVDDDSYRYDPVFSWGWYGDHISAGAAFSWRVARALAKVPRLDRKQFLKVADELAMLDSVAIQRVLAYAYTENARFFTSEIVGYLAADARRLRLGEVLEAPNYDSGRLIAAVFPQLGVDEKAKVERLIVEYEPRAERQVRGRRGRARLEFLKSLPSDDLTIAGREALRELENRFPEFERRRPQGVTGGAVGPPIKRDALAKMPDRDWLRAMRKYNASTEWGSRHRDPLAGGVIEISRAFAERVKAEPERFFSFALELPIDVAQHYPAAALTGLSEVEGQGQSVFDLFRRLASRLTDDHRRSAVWAIEKCHEAGIPDDILSVMEEWALHDPDPDREMWQVTADVSGQTFYSGDPHHHGINSNRGAAINGFCRGALTRRPPQVELAFSVLERASNDVSTAVRACIIENLPYLLQYDAERVLALFERTIDGRPALLACKVTHRLLYHTYAAHFNCIRPYVEQMLDHQDDETREYGAVLACLAAFSVPDARALVTKVLMGDVPMRHGAARVYAANLGQPDCEATCLEYLRQLATDENVTVREEVGRCFSYANSEQVPRLSDFIRWLQTQPVLADSAEHLVKYLIPMAGDMPEVALEVITSILEMAGEHVVDIRTSTALIEPELVKLALVVYTRSPDASLRSRAMDEFERLLLMGSRSARQALVDYDRR